MPLTSRPIPDLLEGLKRKDRVFLPVDDDESGYLHDLQALIHQRGEEITLKHSSSDSPKSPYLNICSLRLVGRFYGFTW